MAALTLAVIPVFVAAANQQRWALAAELAALAAVATALVVVPVRGRSATGWLLASLSFTVGRAFGWTSWRSKAATGKAEALEDADLPGVMTGIEVHDGAPKGPAQTRHAVIQDHGLRTWAMTAAMRHPGECQVVSRRRRSSSRRPRRLSGSLRSSSRRRRRR